MAAFVNYYNDNLKDEIEWLFQQPTGSISESADRISDSYAPAVPAGMCTDTRSPHSPTAHPTTRAANANCIEGIYIIHAVKTTGDKAIIILLRKCTVYY